MSIGNHCISLGATFAFPAPVFAPYPRSPRRVEAALTISTANTTKKADYARADGYEHGIDLSTESAQDGVLRITGGKGVDVVVDGVSGKLTSQAPASLALGGTIVVAVYAGGKEAAVNVTDIIWKAATIRRLTFRLFAPEMIAAANRTILNYDRGRTEAEDQHSLSPD